MKTTKDKIIMKRILTLAIFLILGLFSFAQNAKELKPTIKNVYYVSDAEKPLKKSIPKFSMVHCDVIMDSVRSMYVTRHYSADTTFISADTSYFYVGQKYASWFFTLAQCPAGTTFRDFVHTTDACVVAHTGFWHFDKNEDEED